MTPRYVDSRRRNARAGEQGPPLEGGRCWPVSNDRPGANHRPRGPGGTHPGRTSAKRNVTTPLGSGRHGLLVGRT